ncbi:MAG: PAS domain-containing protein [Bacteroidales bacterium]|nr:PAS domain-containing protein [Bacteroidales bacterium]
MSAIHPDDIEKTLKVWNKAVNTRTPYETEYRLKRHDGVYRYFLARSFPTLRKMGVLRSGQVSVLISPIVNWLKIHFMN